MKLNALSRKMLNKRMLSDWFFATLQTSRKCGRYALRNMVSKFIGLIISLVFGVKAMAVDHIDFKVEIPDSWILIAYSADEGLWEYESENKNHRLTISILYYSKESSHAEQREFLEDFIRTRQEQTSKISPVTNYSKIQVTEYENAWVSKFNEVSINGKFSKNKTISSKIGIANFYFESISSYEIHEEISDRILLTTGFAS